MFRLIYLLIGAMVLAAAFAWLASAPGTLSAVWHGYRIETSFAFLLVLVGVLIVAGIATYRFVKGTLGGPEAFFAYRRERRRRLGYSALTDGLIAIAAGDAVSARKLAGKAQGLLDEPGVTLLLKAQAAQLENNDGAAETSYKEMLAYPDTEFAGLRGLFGLAGRRGNREAALGYAKQAFALKPDTPWIAHALVELQSAAGQWADAAETVAQSAKTKLIASDVAKRQQAVLYTEQAIAADEAGQDEEARKWSEKALGLVPGLVPVVSIAAKYFKQSDKTWKAAEVIEAAWTVDPHPDLARLYEGLKEDADLKVRAKWLKGLADFNKDHMESRLLRARQDVKLKKWKAARRALRDLSDTYATARVCALMADIERGENPDEGDDADKVRQWLARAVTAPRDAHWLCETCGREAEAWSSVCGNCGAFDSLSWRVPELVNITPVSFDDLETEIEEKASAPEEAAPTPLPVVRIMTERQPLPSAGASTAETKEPSKVVVLPPIDDEVYGESVAAFPHDILEADEQESPTEVVAPTPENVQGRRKKDEPNEAVVLPPSPDDPGVVPLKKM